MTRNESEKYIKSWVDGLTTIEYISNGTTYCNMIHNESVFKKFKIYIN